MITETVSNTMTQAIAYAKMHGGKLTRYPGGFWTHEGAYANNTHPVTFGTSTVAALVMRGVMRYSRFQESTRGFGRFPIEAELVEAHACT